MNAKRFGIFFILFIMLTPMIHDVHSFGADDKKAVLYANEACGHCNMYIDSIKVYLEDLGYDTEIRYMINDPTIRTEVNKLNVDNDIPVSMQGHLIINLNDRLFLEGHVPVEIIDPFMKKYPKGDFPKTVIFQDEMADIEDLKSYRVMDAYGNIKECAIDDDATVCLQDDNEKSEKLSEMPLIFLVLLTGFIDGVNPCAFAVLLFFIAFLFTMKRTKAEIYKVGTVYIIAIFLAYVSIGLGILKVIALSQAPHFMAQVGAYLVIFLGLINLKDYFWYGRGFSLKIPQLAHTTIKRYVQKATLPSSFILGFLVGLCTFPCSGGIYVAILGLLSTQVTYMQGLGYLALYNVMFVMPLIITLLFASNKRVVGKMEEWQASEKKHMKLMSGLVMITLGLVIILGVI